MTRVTTWQAPDGDTYTLCAHHQREHERGDWPRNRSGEYCTVSYGRHLGHCDDCTRAELAAEA